MKIIKIIFINILFLILFLGIFELILFFYYSNKEPNEKYHIGKIPYINLLTPDRFRPPVGVNYNKRPIIILGCSFAFGQYLNENQTLGYKLANYSHRPVYNYAVCGKGIQNALFILQNKLYDTSIKDPEFIIYVMMSDHIRRLYTNVCMGDFVGYPDYRIDKNGNIKLYRDYFPVYRQFYTFYYFNNLFYKYILRKNYKRHNLYINAYFEEMNKEIKKQFPNIKFVILIYGDKNNFGLDLSKLEKDGFIILQTDEISGVNLLQRKYQLSETDTHPTEEAWDIIIPALVNRLCL